MGLSQHKSPKSSTSLWASERSETSAEISHLAREAMPYAFFRTISDVLCTFKRFHNFNFHQSARWVYLGPGVIVGSLFWSARTEHLKSLYYALLHPYFTYGIALWGCAQCCYLHPIKKENNSVRCISNAKYNYNAMEIFNKLLITQVKDIHSIEFIKFMFLHDTTQLL